MKHRMVARAAVTGAAFLSTLSMASAAHAVVVATGNFAYADRLAMCVETYAGSQAGLSGCGVTLTVYPFAVRVLHDQDGTCSGAAPATVSISSPTLVHPPAARGYLVVSHGVGTFSGAGASGVSYSFVEATLTGAVCRPLTELGELQTFSGKYEWQA